MPKKNIKNKNKKFEDLENDNIYYSEEDGENSNISNDYDVNSSDNDSIDDEDDEIEVFFKLN